MEGGPSRGLEEDLGTWMAEDLGVQAQTSRLGPRQWRAPRLGGAPWTSRTRGWMGEETGVEARVEENLAHWEETRVEARQAADLENWQGPGMEDWEETGIQAWQGAHLEGKLSFYFNYIP